MRTEVELDIASILGLEAIIRLLPAWIASRKECSFFECWQRDGEPASALVALAHSAEVAVGESTA
jgi:hypothetical protein